MSSVTFHLLNILHRLLSSFSSTYQHNPVSQINILFIIFYESSLLLFIPVFSLSALSLTLSYQSILCLSIISFLLSSPFRLHLTNFLLYSPVSFRNFCKSVYSILSVYLSPHSLPYRLFNLKTTVADLFTFPSSSPGDLSVLDQNNSFLSIGCLLFQWIHKQESGS